MTQTSRLVIEIDSNAARRNVQIITQEIQRLNQAGNTTVNTTVNINNGLRATERQMNATSNAARSLIGQLGVMAVTYKAITASDDFVGLKNRLILVTNSQQELNTALNTTFDIAQRTGSTWENVATIYQRLAQNSKELGLSQQRVAAISETVAKAMAVSGGTAQSQAAALIQFNQGLGSGVLRGEEFNSIMEQGLGLAQALAKGIGVPIGKLRSLAQEGKLTSDVLISALTKVAPEVAASFDKTTFTIGQNLTKLQNSVVKFVGENNGGSAAALANGIGKLAENLELIANTGAAVAVGLLTKSLVAGTIAGRDRVATSIAERNATLAAAQAEVQRTGALVTVARANAAATITEVNAARAEYNSAASAEARRVALGRLTTAQIADRAATYAATQASIANTEAKIAETAATSRLAAAKVSVMGLLGGPAGLIGLAVAAGAAFYLMRDSSDAASKSIDRQGKSVAQLAEEYKKLSLSQAVIESKALRESIEESEQVISQSIGRLQNLKMTGPFESFDRELFDQIIGELKSGSITGEQALKRLINSGKFNQATIDSVAEYAVKIDNAKTKADGAAAANKQLNDITKNLTTTANQAAIAAKKHADELGGVATNADTARKAVEKYINQQRESIKRDAFQYTLETKFNYDPARAKAYADAYGATGANGKLDPAAKQYAEQSYQEQKKLGDLANARREAEKKERKEESDAEKERKRLFKERQNDYKNYAESLTDESVIIDKEYSRQVDLIKAFAVGDEKARLLQRSLAVAQEKQAELGIQNARFYNSFFENENSKADLIRTHYAQEKELIFNNAKLSKAEREDIFNALTRQQDRELAALDRQQQQELLSQRQVYMTATGYAMERYRLERQEIQQNLQLSEEYRKKLLEVNQANMFAARDQAGAAVGNIQQRFNEALMQRDNPRGFAQYQMQNQYEGDSGALAGAYQNNQDGINAKGDDGQYLLDEQTRNQRLLDAHQQFLSAKATMDAEYAAQDKDLRDTQTLDTLGTYSTLFDSMANILTSGADKQSGAYRAMFAVSKGFAIAESVVKIQQALAQTLADPTALTPMQKFANYAAIGTQAMSIIQNLKSVSPKGFSAGGYTGSGGKYDPAGLVHKGEVVWSQDDIKRWGGVNAVESMRTSSRVDGAIAQSRSGVSSSTPKVTINNYGNDRVNVSDDGSGGITIDIVRQEIAKGAPAAVANDLASSPNSTTSKAMSRHYQVQRNR